MGQSADGPGDEWVGAHATQRSISPSDLYLWIYVEAAGSTNMMGAGYLNTLANTVMHGVLLI